MAVLAAEHRRPCHARPVRAHDVDVGVLGLVVVSPRDEQDRAAVGGPVDLMALSHTGEVMRLRLAAA